MAALLFGTGDSVHANTSESAVSDRVTIDCAGLTNAVVGDLIVAAVHGQVGSATPTTDPPGWTRVGPAPHTSGGRQTGIYYFPVDSEDALDDLLATHTWVFAGGTMRTLGIAARATGIDLDDIVDVAATDWDVSADSGTTRIIDGITTTDADTLVVMAWSKQNSSGANADVSSISPTMAYEYRRTSVLTTLSTTGLLLGGRVLSAAGPTGTETITYTGGTIANSGGAVVAFRVGAWSPPTPPNEGVEVSFTSATDTLDTGALFYTSATDTLETPLEVRPVPTGYDDVDAFMADLANPAVTPYCAHRGGSLNWPEMSLHAYTQSVFWGVGALEISVGRSSDGVLFGLHDSTLDRTSGVTGIDPTTLTWAQIQASYQISAGLPSGQTAKPYMRLTDLLDAYSQSHVIFVDPKVLDSTNRLALLDVLDSYGGPDRFIAKYYGVSTGWPTQAGARGYKRWGYFYQDDVPSLATYQDRWEILGMDYLADSASWTAVNSYSKPVMGHIVPSLAGATTALGFGADGLMVSGVTQIVPRT